MNPQDITMQALPLVKFLAAKAKRDYITFRGKVFTLAHSPLSEEDLVQESLVSILENAHKYDGTRPFNSFVKAYSMYAMTQASHTGPVSITRYGWERNRFEQVDLEACEYTPSQEATPEEHQLSAERHELIKEGLAQLQSKEREILELRYFQDKSWREIGERYSCSHQAVQQLANKAKRKLERELKEKITYAF